MDRAGELYIPLACVKVVPRPRGSGPGIIFEHADIDPAIDRGLGHLFQTTGCHGVFDAEFIDCGPSKPLIDVNPRFYNHMACEIDRGLHLPWLVYLAATRDRGVLKGEVAKAKGARVLRRAYVHRLPAALLLATQKLRRAMSDKDQLRWRRWLSEHRGSITDPARAFDDPAPGVVEVAIEALAVVRCPRGYLQGLTRSPGYLACHSASHCAISRRTSVNARRP